MSAPAGHDGQPWLYLRLPGRAPNRPQGKQSTHSRLSGTADRYGANDNQAVHAREVRTPQNGSAAHRPCRCSDATPSSRTSTLADWPGSPGQGGDPTNHRRRHHPPHMYDTHKHHAQVLMQPRASTLAAAPTRQVHAEPRSQHQRSKHTTIKLVMFPARRRWMNAGKNPVVRHGRGTSNPRGVKRRV